MKLEGQGHSSKFKVTWENVVKVDGANLSGGGLSSMTSLWSIQDLGTQLLIYEKLKRLQHSGDV